MNPESGVEPRTLSLDCQDDNHGDCPFRGAGSPCQCECHESGLDPCAYPDCDKPAAYSPTLGMTDTCPTHAQWAEGRQSGFKGSADGLNSDERYSSTPEPSLPLCGQWMGDKRGNCAAPEGHSDACVDRWENPKSGRAPSLPVTHCEHGTWLREDVCLACPPAPSLPTVLENGKRSESEFKVQGGTLHISEDHFDAVVRERDELRAEVNRMRPVVEIANRFADTWDGSALDDAGVRDEFMEELREYAMPGWKETR